MSMVLKKEPYKGNNSKLNSILNASTNQSMRNKSLIDPTGMSIFQLSQHQIHFLNTEINEIYEVSMFVRNVSQKKQQIRIKNPKSPYLSVTIVKQGIIAPGLDVKIIITFDSKDNQRLQDCFTIVSQNFQSEIKIHVIPQAGKIQFQPFINFGFIKVGQTKELTWKVSNKCDTLTTIELNASVTGNCQIKIEPNSIMLEPMANKQVKLKITSHEVGHFQGVIDIQPKLFSVSSADFVANFCQYTRFISDDEGNVLTQIIMQPMFAGQKIQISTNLVNNTPKSCEFRISRKKGCPNEDQNNLITPQQFGKDDSQKLISFNPSQGALQPYLSVPLVTRVQANFTQADQQLFCNYILGRINTPNEQKDFSYTVKVHINEQQNPLMLFLKGTLIIPKLALSSTFFDFSETFLNEKKQKEFKIQNYSEKSIKINFKNSSNYSFSHKSIKINSKSSSYVTIIFSPKIVGQLNEVLPMVVGQFSFPIKAIGKGIFSTKKTRKSPSNLITYDSAHRGQQIKVQELDKTLLQNQISYIKGEQAAFNRKNASYYEDTNNKSTVHFQNSYVGTINQSFNGNSIYLTQHKKSRTLRDRNGKQVKITDVQNLNPNEQLVPYPSQPKNQQEQRTVTRELASTQLASIQVGQVVFDIGKICLRSIIKKTFHICNFNNKSISIQLNSNNCESFSESPQEKQILPGNSWGGLLIKFQALKQGDFKQNLQYIINGKHFFEMMITGTVIQPTLTLSKSQIKFFATEQDKSFEKKETLTLTNPYEYQVQFSIAKNQQNSLFRVQPQKGRVPPNGSKVISIVHGFDLVQQFGVKVQESLKIKITHGRNLQVKCLSMVPQCHCISKSQQINFKQVAIGKCYQSKILIKNSSKNFTIYKVLIPKELENVVTASCMSGSLSSEEMHEIVFKIQAFTSMAVDSAVSFLIRGGKTLVLPLRASVISPKIKIQNQKIDFGFTPIEGNPAVKTITLVNDSQIPVEVQFRLPYDSYLLDSLRVTKILDQNSQLIQSTQPQHKSANYKSYIIRMNPKVRSNILLQFTPEDVILYQFLLPLFVLNSNQSMGELQKPCTCKGIKNRLMATEKQLNFGKIIIEQNLESYTKNRSLQIKNPQEEPIEWWIDDSSIHPFSLQKNRGRLEGYQKMNLKVFFYSDVEADYAKELQFFIDQGQTAPQSQLKPLKQQSNQQYLKITVKASACYPTLYFNMPYVIMPLASLNQESRSVFQIVNGGYQNINIKHLVMQEFSNVDIKLNFPDGTNLGVTKKKIKVQVVFQSQKPISFTVKVNFYDSNNRTFTIAVSGTSDNCIYTMIEGQREQQIEKDCNFLRQYINSIGCLQDSIYEFPRSMCENQEQKLNQFLCHLSASFEKIKASVKKNKKLSFSFNFQYLSEVIRTIKSQGGFLNHIRPEMLLATHEQYFEAIKLRTDNNSNIISNYTSILDHSSFDYHNKRSWVILMYQVFKVYSRVNVSKPKNNQFWGRFAARQKMILTWLQQAYQSEAKLDYQKTSTVLEQMNDSELLSSVISKYTNIKVLEVYGRQVKGLKQKQRRIKNIVQTFTQIGINCHCRVEDILRSNPKQMLLIIEGLYLILPSYLQKGEPILFSCALGQTIIKSIQISNPSKHPITYMAKIQTANKAYAIQNQQEFVIQSKLTHEVKIKYISNINLNNSTATLTLTGKAQSKFRPSTFIFVLKSQNLGRISEKNIQVTGQLYEQYDFSINVQNNFESEGEFKVEMINANANKQSPLSFHCINPMVKIKKGEAVNFNLMFIPLILEAQKCLVVFRDSKVGQFQYEVSGLVEPPQLNLEILKIGQQLLTNKKYSINLPIPPKNDNLSKAKKIIESIVERTQKKASKTQVNIVNLEKVFPSINSNDPYSVKIIPSNEMVQLKSDVLYIKDSEDRPAQNAQQGNKEQPKVLLQINMKLAVKQASFILMIRNASGSDMRRYKVLLNSVYKPLRYQLEMKTSVNKLLQQKLPIINISKQPNNFYITMQTNQNSKGIFSLDRQKQNIPVSGISTQNVNLSFRPKSQTTYNGVVKIENTTTGQVIEYQVNGLGQEPQCQMLTFDQEIRKQKVHQVKLPIQKAAKCVVSKFTLQNAVYDKAFIINSTNNCSFKFRYTAKIPGQYQAKLIIQDDSKVYAFKVVVNARDVIEQEIKIKTIQRKAYEGQITSVPEGSYQVSCLNPCIKFERSFVSDEHNQGLFKFQHYSTKPEQVESFLVFTSQKVGQLTYLLKIKVGQMPQFKFQAFKTELGSRHEQSIRFENQQQTPLRINGTCSHPKSFFFEPANIVVPPKSQLNAKLVYVPSKLQLEEGKVSFLSERGQKWNYHMSGYGLLQSKPTTVQMCGLVGKQKIESISFINPLQKRVQATIQIQDLVPRKGHGSSESPFQLVLKTNKFQLEYSQELILPILLKPQTVSINKCMLTVTISQKIVFRYLLTAISEYIYPEERVFRLQARTKKEDTIIFDLPFLQETNQQAQSLQSSKQQAQSLQSSKQQIQSLKSKQQVQSLEKAKLRITALNQSMKQLLKDSIKVLQKQKNIVEGQKVGFQLTFKAFKPFKTHANLVIQLPNGCKWIQRVNVQFMTPNVDDKIQIVSEMNKPASTRFKLTNRLKNHAKFRAYFDTPSNQFIIHPKNGQLQPLGREGTAFQITFLPNVYKKQWQAKLIIETQDNFWSYDVKGSLPLYLPPIAKSLINSSSAKNLVNASLNAKTLMNSTSAKNIVNSSSTNRVKSSGQRSMFLKKNKQI